MRFSQPIRQAFLSLAFFLLVSGSATAGTLFGTVTEIHDGDTITIICLKRPLEVHLVGTVAPEKDQPYSDVSRQHLSDLILNKEVVVNFSGLGDNALIVGRVFLKEQDIGAQMLRDGVAWYDKPYDTILTDDQRQMYLACEVAARDEHRGIWKDPKPVPPWEFKESRKVPEPPKPAPTVNGPPVSQRIRKPELTTESLSPSFANPGALSLGSSEAVPISTDGRWIRFSQPAAKASVLVPGDGTKRSTKVLLKDGRVVDVNVYLGRAERTGFMVVSSTGQDAHESDTEILDGGITGLVSGVKSDFLRLGKTFDCYPELERSFSLSGYSGRQYDLSGCTVPGRARFYTRVLNNVRELYVTAVFFFGPDDDPNITRFLDSFAVSTPARPSRSKSSPALSKTSATPKKI